MYCEYEEEHSHALFAYGTLRPGETNYSLIEPAVLDAEHEVTIRGSLYYYCEGAHFPVADLWDASSRLIGDLLLVDCGSHLQSVLDMEYSAGYEFHLLSRQYILDNNHKSISFDFEDAIAFHYNHAIKGPQIDSGDWKKRNAQN